MTTTTVKRSQDDTIIKIGSKMSRLQPEEQTPLLLLLQSSERAGIQPCYGSPSSLSLRRRQQRLSAASNARISTSLRILTNAMALLSTVFFSGIIFGWAPLKLLLQREGQYYDDELLATEHEFYPGVATTAAALKQYNRIFTVAQFVLSFASLPIGFFLDVSSKTVHFGLAALFEIIGLILFGISDSKNGDYFLLSYSLLALGGCMTMLGSFPASFLLPQYQAGILAAISCLFDASSIIFAIFDRCNTMQPNVWTRRHLFTVYAVIAILLYTILACCWGVLEQRDWKTIAETETRQKQQKQQQPPLEKNRPKEEETISMIHDHKENASSSSDDDVGLKHKPVGKDLNHHHTERIHRLGIHEWTLLRQLRTLEFVTVLVFACIHMLRCNYYIETVNEQLAIYGDDDDHDSKKYARMFSLVLPSGIIFVPVIERTIQRLGVVSTLHITNGIGVLFGTLLLIPSLQLQAVNFVVFTAFRAFLYATLNTFIAVSFGVSTMGRVIGCTFTTAAMVTLLQYPAASFAERRGSFHLVNCVMVLACILPISFGCWYSHCIRRRPG
jgi:hypothetical protein